MAKSIAGVCYVKVDGEQLALQGSLACSMSSVTREPQIATIGVVGYSETPIAPSISGTFFVPNDFPMERLMSATDMTIVAELANGKVFTLSDAFVAGEATVSASDGTTSLTFNGIKGNWA